MGYFFRVIPKDIGHVPCTFYPDINCRNPAEWVYERTEATICIPCYEVYMGVRQDGDSSTTLVGRAIAAARAQADHRPDSALTEMVTKRVNGKTMKVRERKGS